MIQELNKDQLTALANMSFDIAKGAFAFAFVPTLNAFEYGLSILPLMLLSFSLGLAFTNFGLLLLKRKERLL